jgi:hypothetical protein
MDVTFGPLCAWAGIDGSNAAAPAIVARWRTRRRATGNSDRTSRWLRFAARACPPELLLIERCLGGAGSRTQCLIGQANKRGRHLGFERRRGLDATCRRKSVIRTIGLLFCATKP